MVPEGASRVEARDHFILPGPVCLVVAGSLTTIVDFHIRVVVGWWLDQLRQFSTSGKNMIYHGFARQPCGAKTVTKVRHNDGTLEII